MRYKNTKTGNVIDVASEIKGKYWEPIKVPSASKPEPKAAPAPKKEATKPAPKPAAPAPKAAPKKTTTKTKRK